MPKVNEVCKYVRSKNAGPFWVTIDLFFDGKENFDKYAMSDALNGELFARLYGTKAELVKRIPVSSLNVVKFSYPRINAQGWMGERDMHQGQSFALLLDIDLH